MLVAKINPPAKKLVQETPFSHTEVLGEYMIAKCSHLVIGASQNSQNDEIEFTVRFGNIKQYINPDGTTGRDMFDAIVNTKVKFSHQQLSDWGTDDTIIYTKIANKLGFNIISTETRDMRFTM